MKLHTRTVGTGSRNAALVHGASMKAMQRGVHDLHVQDPRRLAGILADVLEPESA